MKQPNNTHGGKREGAGRPPKNPQEGKRVKTSFTVTASNLDWLDSQAASRSDIVNLLIEKARK